MNVNCEIKKSSNFPHMEIKFDEKKLISDGGNLEKNDIFSQ